MTSAPFRVYGYDDRFLVWEGHCIRESDVVDTTPVTCTCGQLNLKRNCIHMGFVRELIARDIDARNPVRLRDLKRVQAPPKWPADGRTTSPFLGVNWCPTLGRWRASIMVAGKHYNLGRFEREEDAAKAYDWATYYRLDRDVRRMGKRPQYNFPDDLPSAMPQKIRPRSPIWRVLRCDHEDTLAA